MATRSKKSSDEKRLTILREIANEGANRNCLECHQRGPTYVDMTIGSFICTKCCGILRGLNPPHRVKSITMTTFNEDELEFIKNRGNEFNRYVYLGTYDERSNLERESLREEHKIREFMVQKYERKRWFVDPDIAQHKMQLDRRQKQAAESGVSLTGGSIQQSKPVSTAFATRSQPVTPAGGDPWPTTAKAPAAPQGSTSFNGDLFAFCKEAIPPPVDPFRRPNNPNIDNRTVLPPPKHQPSSVPTAGGDGFADFDSAFSSFAGDTSSCLVYEVLPPPNLPNVPPATASSSSTPLAAAIAPSKGYLPAADRYAALADLDNLFNQQIQPTSTSESVAAPPSIDPWGHHPASAAGAAAINPFSPPAASSLNTNPWGPPPPSGHIRQATSPNPFAASSQSTMPPAWASQQPSRPTGSPVTVPLGRTTPTLVVNQITNSVAGMKLTNGNTDRLTPTGWAQTNGFSAINGMSGGLPSANHMGGLNSTSLAGLTANAALNSFGGSDRSALNHLDGTMGGIPSSNGVGVSNQINNTFATSWGAGSPAIQEQAAFPQVGGSNFAPNGNPSMASKPGGNWATFSTQNWSGSASGLSNGSAGGVASFAEVWPQMPNSASTPAFARSQSPAQITSNSQFNKALPQSISLHEQFPCQWPNGSSNQVTNGQSNPFSPTASSGFTARSCSASNPFL